MAQMEMPVQGFELPIQDLRLYKLPRGFRGRPAWFVQLWWLVQATLFRLSPQPLYGWRNWLLRLFGAKIGAGTIIRQTVETVYPWRLTIGERCQIGDHVSLYTLGEISIGNDSVISQHAYICTGSHDYTRPSFDIVARPIRIGSECWVATGVMVGPGVVIGNGSVIGARSLVLNDVPERVLCVGNPLRILGPRPTASNAVTQPENETAATAGNR